MSGNTQQYDTVELALKSERERLRREKEKERGITFYAFTFEEESDEAYFKKSESKKKGNQSF